MNVLISTVKKTEKKTKHSMKKKLILLNSGVTFGCTDRYESSNNDTNKEIFFHK